MKNLVKYTFILLVSAVCQNSLAAQSYKVDDGDVIEISVASHEFNRIAMKGETKLIGARGNKKEEELKFDSNLGEVLFKPKSSLTNKISFFVTDSNHQTYTVHAKVSPHLPPQTSSLEPKNKIIKQKGFSRFKTQPYLKSIKQLLKGMALGEAPSGYLYQEKDDGVPLWKETKITLKALYRSDYLEGDVYVLVNVSDKPMRLNESEFMGFGDGVKAVALSLHQLRKGESAFLYIVRKYQ